MQLFDLSLDLASSILDYLEPYDLESLALVCHGTYTLLTPLLPRYNEYRRVWHKVVLGHSLLPMCSFAESQSARPGERKKLRTVHQLLVQIAKDPESVRYIQHLDLAFREFEDERDPRDYVADPDNETSTSPDQNRIASKRLMNDLAAISRVLQRPDPELSRWYDDIDLDEDCHDGFAHYPTLFLLSLLPNLRSLTLPSLEREPTLRLLAVNAQLDTLKFSDLDGDAGRSDYDSQGGIDMTVLLPFLALPSLRNVQFKGGILHEVKDNVSACYRPIGAQVEQLDLDYSCWYIDAGTALLQDMKALRVLKVNFDLKDVDFNYWCQDAVDTVAKVARKTLEVLSLTTKFGWEQPMEKPLRSLRGFERLRELELGTGLFFTTGDGHEFRNGPPANSEIDLEADFEYTCDFYWQDHEYDDDDQEGQGGEEQEEGEMDDQSEAGSQPGNTDGDGSNPNDVDDSVDNDSVDEDMDSDDDDSNVDEDMDSGNVDGNVDEDMNSEDDDCFSVHGGDAWLAKTCPSLTQLLRSESLATLEKLTLHVEAQDTHFLCMKRLLRNLHGIGVGVGGGGGGGGGGSGGSSSDGDGNADDDGEDTPHPCPRLTSLAVCLYTEQTSVVHDHRDRSRIEVPEDTQRLLGLAQEWLGGIPGCKVRVVPYDGSVTGARAAWHASVAHGEIEEEEAEGDEEIAS